MDPMKKLYVLLAFFACILSTAAQLPSDCTVPDVIRNNYKFDIGHLAFKWLHEIQSPDTSLIEIPESAQGPIREGLAAIFNRHDFPEVDSVFNLYCVHNSAPHSLVHQGLWVRVDTAFAWARNWATLQTITGIPALDSLLAKYAFTVTTYYPSTQGSWAEVTLTTTKCINVLPVCDSLKTFAGFIFAKPNLSGGDGSTIEFEYAGDVRYYTFTMKWGDCWAGCTSSHAWKFKVNPDCSIELINVVSYISDHYYPPLSYCNLSFGVSGTSVPPVVTIFPNPAEGFLAIRASIPEEISYNLVDGWGRIAMSGTLRGETTLDLRTLSHGLYFIMIRNNGVLFSTKKIIVE
jgi:hypothetical protein